MLPLFLFIFILIELTYNTIFMYCSGATCELFIWKIPQNVWAENLRNMLVQLFRQSCFNAPANTSYSFTLSWSLQW
jgi:hypothetical protein